MNFTKLSAPLCAGALALAITGFHTPASAQGAGGSGAPQSTEQPTTQPNPNQRAPVRGGAPAPMQDTTGQAPREGTGSAPASEAGSGGGAATGQGSGATTQPSGDPRANPDAPVRR